MFQHETNFKRVDTDGNEDEDDDDDDDDDDLLGVLVDQPIIEE